MTRSKSNGAATGLSIGLMALLATLAFAQPGGFGGGHGGMGGRPGLSGGGPGMGGGPEMGGEFGPLARLLGALDLTDAQKEEIRTIMDNAREDIEAIRDAYQGIEPRRELLDLFLQEDLSLSEVQAVFDDIDRVKEETRDIMLEALVDVHDVLTSEQLARLGELVEQFGSGGPHMGGGPGFGGPGFGGPPQGGGPDLGF